MKTKKRLIAVFLILAALALAAVLGAKPLYYLYRDVSFYFGERTVAEQTVKAFAEENHISYGRYPEDLIELLEINPETKDFVLNYPFREEIPVDLSSYSRATVPLFLQWDPMWGYEKYGSGCIGQTGCGPTCLAMAGYYLTGDDRFNPKDIADFSAENGYYASGYGSSWTLISEGAGKLGLNAKELPLVKKKMVDAVENGHPVIWRWARGASPPPGITSSSQAGKKMPSGSTTPTAGFALKSCGRTRNWRAKFATSGRFPYNAPLTPPLGEPRVPALQQFKNLLSYTNRKAVA